MLNHYRRQRDCWCPIHRKKGSLAKFTFWENEDVGQHCCVTVWHCQLIEGRSWVVVMHYRKQWWKKRVVDRKLGATAALISEKKICKPCTGISSDISASTVPRTGASAQTPLLLLPRLQQLLWELLYFPAAQIINLYSAQLFLPSITQGLNAHTD